MTSIEDTQWIEKYTGIRIVQGSTMIQDLLIVVAKKLDKLERKFRKIEKEKYGTKTNS